MKVPGRLILWISEWLNDRKAKVKYGGEMGKCRRLKAGVPQGGVLCPLLFIIFVNDIMKYTETNNHKGNYSIFADDLTIWATTKKELDLNSILQKMVDTVTKWADTWHMKLNVNKCCCMRLTQNPKEVHRTLDIKGKR